VKVGIAGREFDNVRAERAPEMTERAAAVMAAKYWSDLLISLARHPLTVRLNMPSPAAGRVYPLMGSPSEREARLAQDQESRL
jgi:hypothetical protein